MKLEEPVVNSILHNNQNSSKSVSITKKIPTRLRCHKCGARKNKLYWGNNKWNLNTSVTCPFFWSFQFKKNWFNYIKSIQTLITYTSFPLEFHSCSEMLYFKFPQQLFSSKAKVLILQNANYIKASERGVKKGLLLPIHKAG